MDKAKFLTLFHQKWNRLEGILAKIPAGRVTQPGVEGDWSVKDLLAHIAWYEREMIGALTARALVGSELWEKNHVERNREIYAQNKDRSWEEILAEFQQIHRALTPHLESLAADDFLTPHNFRDWPEDVPPWVILAENTYEHYLAHLDALENWAASTETG
jgi:uncharacterized damage-inducible protein DinB